MLRSVDFVYICIVGTHGLLRYVPLMERGTKRNQPLVPTMLEDNDVMFDVSLGIGGQCKSFISINFIINYQ